MHMCHEIKNIVNTEASHSHRCSRKRPVDGWHIQTGEDVAVHVVGTNNVVNLGSIDKQVARLIRQEVSINDRCKYKVFDHGGWGRETFI